MTNPWIKNDMSQDTDGEWVSDYEGCGKKFIVKLHSQKQILCKIIGHHFDGSNFDDDYAVRDYKSGAVIDLKDIAYHRPMRSRCHIRIRRMSKLKKNKFKRKLWF